MFENCKSLISISDNISQLDTFNIIDMSNMFNLWNGLKTLPDISTWDTSNVEDMSEMFAYCSSLEFFPYISKWNTSNVVSIEGIFKGCKKFLFYRIFRNGILLIFKTLVVHFLIVVLCKKSLISQNWTFLELKLWLNYLIHVNP